MTKWEMTTYYVEIGTDPANLWIKKDKKSNKSAWDEIKALASDGWEPVGVTLISYSWSTYLLYTFKRPMTDKA